MRILFVEQEVNVPEHLTIGPLGTLMTFDQTELDLVEKVVRGFLQTYHEDERDEFYDQLLQVHQMVLSNIPTTVS